MSNVIDRTWIEEFQTPEGSGFNLEPVSREFIIREHQPGMFSLFQTHPDKGLGIALTLDEAIGYTAIALAANNRRGAFLRTVDEQRAWAKKYGAHTPDDAPVREESAKASA